MCSAPNTSKTPAERHSPAGGAVTAGGPGKPHGKRRGRDGSDGSGPRQGGRRLTILHIGDHEAAGIRNIIDDFCDALRAYERLSAARASEGMRIEPLEVTRLTALTPAEIPTDEALVTEAAPMLIAIAAEDLAARSEEGASLPLQGLGASRLYAVVTTDRTDAAEGTRAMGRLERASRDAGLPFGGGVILCGALLLERHAGTPRMGRLRRARSEHIDRLIAAVRFGCTVSMLPDTDGSNVLVAPCPVPGALYRVLAATRRERA